MPGPYSITELLCACGKRATNQVLADGKVHSTRCRACAMRELRDLTRAEAQARREAAAKAAAK